MTLSKCFYFKTKIKSCRSCSCSLHRRTLEGWKIELTWTMWIVVDVVKLHAAVDVFCVYHVCAEHNDVQQVFNQRRDLRRST